MKRLIPLLILISILLSLKAELKMVEGIDLFSTLLPICIIAICIAIRFGIK